MSKYFKIKKEMLKILPNTFENRIEEILEAINVEDINLVRSTMNEQEFMDYFKRKNEYMGKEVLDEQIVTLHGDYVVSVVKCGLKRDKFSPVNPIQLNTDVVIILKTLKVKGKDGTETIKNIYVYKKDERLERLNNKWNRENK